MPESDSSLPALRPRTQRRRNAASTAAAPPAPDQAGLLALTSDAYWEQDAEFRFRRIVNTLPGRAPAIPECCLGLTPWDAGFVPVAPQEWDQYRADLCMGGSVRNFIAARDDASGNRTFVSLTGACWSGDDGCIAGFRGIVVDVTEQQRLEQELLQFSTAMDASLDMIFMVDRETMCFVYVNEMACTLSGFTREELLQMTADQTMGLTRAELERAYDELIVSETKGVTLQLPSYTKAGVRTMVEIHRRALQLNGRWMIVSIVHDISERILAERANERLRRMFAALSSTNEAILKCETPDALYDSVCRAAVDGGGFVVTAVALPGARMRAWSIAASATLGGVDLDGLVGRRGSEAESLADAAYRSGLPQVRNEFAGDQRMQPWHEWAKRHRIRSGAAVPLIRHGETMGALLVFAHEQRAFDDEVVSLLGRMAENVVFALDNFAHEQERRRSQERIQFMATHDALTNLPNRVMFNEVLRGAIETARRYERSFGVMFIDLDRFKVINDSLGHDAGDTLLKIVSCRMRDSLRASDVVARIGGDEFVVLLQEVGDRTQATAIARKLLQAAIEIVDLDGQECRVTASIGIALYPRHGDDVETLMRHADQAMYAAKEAGKNNFQFFSKRIRNRSLERLTLEAQLRQALGRNELSLRYQAKLDLTTKRITGAEALLRWHNAQLGNVTPTQLLPVAEETGLIVPIGRWVLDAACAQNVAWQRQGLPKICMGVNLSPRQFTDPQLIDSISAALNETGMAPELLELEVAESVVMASPDTAVRILKGIRELGVRTAIDDFGTSYSSLALLKKFPVDALKVDRSFIRELPRHKEDRSITETVIAMGRSLGITVVAEGVETPQQQAYLVDHECDEVQGFLFSRPVVPDEFAKLLKGHRKPD
jgi:diguanylate cyclase (GGDEF)-like protein/PAS domain S-box-containing protein